MPDSPGEVHVVVDLHDTPKIMVFSPDDEPMEGLEDHLKDEDNPEEDQEIYEVAEEQQINQEIDETVGEQAEDQEIDEVKSGASDSSFDLGEEPKDDSNPDYDPSRDHLVISSVDLSRYIISPKSTQHGWSGYMHFVQHVTLYMVSQILLTMKKWFVSLFGHVTDLVSMGQLVFQFRVGVRADLTQLVRCDILLLIMYVNIQLRM